MTHLHDFCASQQTMVQQSKGTLCIICSRLCWQQIQEHQGIIDFIEGKPVVYDTLVLFKQRPGIFFE